MTSKTGRDIKPRQQNQWMCAISVCAIFAAAIFVSGKIWISCACNRLNYHSAEHSWQQQNKKGNQIKCRPPSKGIATTTTESVQNPKYRRPAFFFPHLPKTRKPAQHELLMEMLNIMCWVLQVCSDKSARGAITHHHRDGDDCKRVRVFRISWIQQFDRQQLYLAIYFFRYLIFFSLLLLLLLLLVLAILENPF